MAATARRTGRPHTAALSRELIVETALRLLDERGEHGAGMRDIARELGVRPSALYNHVKGKEDVVDGIRELVSDRFDISGFGVLPWDRAVERWARSYLGSFAAPSASTKARERWRCATGRFTKIFLLISLSRDSIRLFFAR